MRDPKRERAAYEELFTGQRLAQLEEREQAMKRYTRQQRGKLLVCAGLTIIGAGMFYTHPALGAAWTAILCLSFGFHWSTS
jgi:hypothetical protein